MSYANPSDPAIASSGTRIEEADIAAGEALGAHRHRPALRLAARLSDIADGIPAAAACGGVLAAGLLSGRPRLAEAGGRMLASVLVATALKNLAKGLVSRTRPHVLIERGRYALRPLGGGGGDEHAFSSGHAAGAAAAARGLVRVFPAAWGPACGATAAVALVRVLGAKHYPLDVAAGALIGAASEVLVDRAAAGLAARADRPVRRRRARAPEA